MPGRLRAAVALLGALLPAVACAASQVPSGSSEGGVWLRVTGRLEVYARPDSAAGVWGLVQPGDSLPLSGVTRDGWLGFDPGVPQAGNSGSFRYRWVAPGGACVLSGDASALDTLWGPAAGIVYAMTFDPVPVLEAPDASADAADTLPGCSAARIAERFEGWYLVDPSDGPAPAVLPGWIPEEAVSVSGDPESVPTPADQTGDAGIGNPASETSTTL